MLYILKISFTGVVVLRIPFTHSRLKAVMLVTVVTYACFSSFLWLVGSVDVAFFLEFSTSFNLFLFD